MLFLGFCESLGLLIVVRVRWINLHYAFSGISNEFKCVNVFLDFSWEIFKGACKSIRLLVREYDICPYTTIQQHVQLLFVRVFRLAHCG